MVVSDGGHIVLDVDDARIAWTANLSRNRNAASRAIFSHVSRQLPSSSSLEFIPLDFDRHRYAIEFDPTVRHMLLIRARLNPLRSWKVSIQVCPEVVMHLELRPFGIQREKVATNHFCHGNSQALKPKVGKRGRQPIPKDRYGAVWIAE